MNSNQLLIFMIVSTIVVLSSVDCRLSGQREDEPSKEQLTTFNRLRRDALCLFDECPPSPPPQTLPPPPPPPSNLGIAYRMLDVNNPEKLTRSAAYCTSSRTLIVVPDPGDDWSDRSSKYAVTKLVTSTEGSAGDWFANVTRVFKSFSSAGDGVKPFKIVVGRDLPNECKLKVWIDNSQESVVRAYWICNSMCGYRAAPYAYQLTRSTRENEQVLESNDFGSMINDPDCPCSKSILFINREQNDKWALIGYYTNVPDGTWVVRTIKPTMWRDYKPAI